MLRIFDKFFLHIGLESMALWVYFPKHREQLHWGGIVLPPWRCKQSDGSLELDAPACSPECALRIDRPLASLIQRRATLFCEGPHWVLIPQQPRALKVETASILH